MVPYSSSLYTGFPSVIYNSVIRVYWKGCDKNMSTELPYCRMVECSIAGRQTGTACSMAMTHSLSMLLLYCQKDALLEKNRWKLKFQWIFVDGVEWKSYIVGISMINVRLSLHPINKYSLTFQLAWIFSISVGREACSANELRRNRRTFSVL